MRERGPGLSKAGSAWEAFEALDDGALVRSIVGELDALVDARAGCGLSAQWWGTPEEGGARLIRRLREGETETMKVAWNQRQIKEISIEPRTEGRFEPQALPSNAGAVVDALVPMLWAHLRRGGPVPPGADRFVGFFSLG